jgi:hypothetical protein
VSWIERDYPGTAGKHEITSEPDEEYNCIAWAANDKSTWWSHEDGFKWPAKRSSGIEALVEVFAGLGFKETKSRTLEPGREKVALYAKEGKWTHASRQLTSGKWASKLGVDEDIEHDDPECLCGRWYGKIHCIMWKARK